MLDPIISVLGLMLVALLIVLLTRMVVLNQSTDTPAEADSFQPESPDKTLLTEGKDNLSILLDAQRFAKQQLQDCFQDLDNLPSKLSEHEVQAVALYLIAAIEFMGSKKQCSSKYRRIMAIKVLEAELGFNAADISRYYSIALSSNQDSEAKHFLGLGANAAKKWLVNQAIPEKLNISSQLNNRLDSISYA